MTMARNDVIELPQPDRRGRMAVEVILAVRRSVREFEAGALTLKQVSQLLWAAQGVTDPTGLRTAPSAGALYPLELYLVAGDVAGLEAGVYRYDPGRHALGAGAEGVAAARDIRGALADAALEQDWMGTAAAVLLIAADVGRCAVKYGKRAQRYVHMEAGFAAENVCLQAIGLGLGTTVVGAFVDEEVKRLAGLTEREEPLVLLPVGVPGG